MRAKDVMSVEVFSVTPETLVRDAVIMMLHHRISGLPVVDEKGKLVGLLTENDLVLGGNSMLPLHLQLLDDFLSAEDPARNQQELRKLAQRRVSELMTRDVVTARPETPLGELITLLVQNDFKRIPIIEQGTLVGIVTRADIVKVIK